MSKLHTSQQSTPMIETHRSHRTIRIIVLSIMLLAGAKSARARDLEVGPNRQISVLDQVSWETLTPGDCVKIHWKSTPYRGKWVLCRRGTSAQPITISGIPGPNGQLPVIDGRNAISRPSLDYWSEERGVIKIGGANHPADTMPAHIVIENLEIRGARPPNHFVNRDGVTQYAANAAAIFIEKGEHIKIRNCVLRDSANGLFVNHESQDILIEGCQLDENGMEGSHFEHNSYTAGIGLTFRGNRFGPLRKGCDGNNLKDRSAGLVISHNWIEGGNRQLDLVDAEDSEQIRNHPQYGKTIVYGNVLIEHDNEGNGQIVHYGGDSGETHWYRKGTLYFYNNTVISKRRDNTTVFRLSTSDERAICWNNIFYASESGRSLALLDETGRVELTHNWFSRGWVDSHDRLRGRITGRDAMLVGGDPGFADWRKEDFRLNSNSPCISAGLPVSLAPGLQGAGSKTSAQTQKKPDLGAYKYDR